MDLAVESARWSRGWKNPRSGPPTGLRAYRSTGHSLHRLPRASRIARGSAGKSKAFEVRRPRAPCGARAGWRLFGQPLAVCGALRRPCWVGLCRGCPAVGPRRRRWADATCAAPRRLQRKPRRRTENAAGAAQSVPL